MGLFLFDERVGLEFRVAHSPSLIRFVSWAELNAPVVASIYARCDFVLLNKILLSFCPFDSLGPTIKQI